MVQGIHIPNATRPLLLSVPLGKVLCFYGRQAECVDKSAVPRSGISDFHSLTTAKKRAFSNDYKKDNFASASATYNLHNFSKLEFLGNLNYV